MFQDSPLKIAVHGATGRMGQAIIKLCEASSDFQHVQILSLSKECIHSEGDEDLLRMIMQSHILIDFSSTTGCAQLFQKIKALQIPVLVGTTGLLPKTVEAIERYSCKTPVMMAPNTSLGANLLSYLASLATKAFGPSVDIDIIDHHHKHKKDAPSGTALMIQKAIDAMQKNPVSIHSIRAGETIGTHTVLFSDEYESLEITHTVTSRQVFALGAITYAQWLLTQPQGLYTPYDFLKTKISQLIMP